MKIGGLEFLDYIKDITLKDILDEISPKINEIWDLLQLDIIDWFERQQDIRPVRKLIIDLLGYYVFKDDYSKYDGFVMAPPNDPPDTPDKPIDVGKGEIYNWY